MVSFICNQNNKRANQQLQLSFILHLYLNDPQECQSLCQWTNKGLITSTPNCKLFRRGTETLGTEKVTCTTCR